MNELQEFINKQSDLSLQTAQAITSLTQIVEKLGNRIVYLESEVALLKEDNKHILENMGIKE